MPTLAAALTPGELLAFLRPRGGQEYAAELIVPGQGGGGGRRKKAALAATVPSVPAPRPRYRLTLRGAAVQATGPSGQTRLLEASEFLSVFASYRFAELTPTGQLSDLGPLFGMS
ncbi:hypothetical protein [Deinococcus sp.]|uniref:hypothetical protein n=1 Tax=Deinococcus sp. TaxID=47478 RepID=UPI0025F6502B|nr:hypothetical protein [Deinococcus sp.]